MFDRRPVSTKVILQSEMSLAGLRIRLPFLAIVVGFSLAASVLFLRYRDLNQVWELTLQAGFAAQVTGWHGPEL